MTSPLRGRGPLVGVGWGVFVLTAAAFFRPPLLPDIGRDLEISATGLGGLLSVFALGRLLADLPAGWAIEQRRSDRLMMVAAAIVAAGGLAAALAPGPALLYGAALVMGTGSTLTITTATAAFAAVPRARRGLSLSLFAGAMLAGQAAGPAAGGGLGSLLGWRGAFAAGAGLAAAMCFFYLFSGKGVRLGSAPSGEAPSAAGAPPRALAVLYLIPAAQFAVFGALIQTLIPLVGDGELGWGPGAVGLAIGAGGAIRFLAALAAGHAADRVGRKAALLPGLGLQALGVAAFGWLRGPSGWWAAIIFLTLGSVAVNVGNAALADLSEGDGKLGRRLGAYRLTGDAAFLAAPVITAALFENWGREAAAAPLLIFTLLVFWGTAALVPETRRPAR